MRIELAAWKVEYIDLLVLLLPALVARSWFFGLFRKFAFILVVRAVRSLFHAHAQCALLLFYQNLIEFRSSFFCRRHSKLWIRNEYFMHGHNEIRQLNDGNLIYEFIFSRNICTYTYKCLPKEQSHNIVTFDLIQLVLFRCVCVGWPNWTHFRKIHTQIFGYFVEISSIRFVYVRNRFGQISRKVKWNKSKVLI